MKIRVNLIASFPRSSKLLPSPSLPSPGKQSLHLHFHKRLDHLTAEEYKLQEFLNSPCQRHLQCQMSCSFDMPACLWLWTAVSTQAPPLPIPCFGCVVCCMQLHLCISVCLSVCLSPCPCIIIIIINDCRRINVLLNSLLSTALMLSNVLFR